MCATPYQNVFVFNWCDLHSVIITSDNIKVFDPGMSVLNFKDTLCMWGVSAFIVYAVSV